jgi:hypothetical protein
MSCPAVVRGMNNDCFVILDRLGGYHLFNGCASTSSPNLCTESEKVILIINHDCTVDGSKSGYRIDSPA